MSTLKSYHIHHLEAQSKQMQKEYCRLRELIKLGDMQAVEELSELKKNIASQRNKIAQYQQKFKDTQIEVFLFALSTLLNTLLDSHQTLCTIKEERTALPWKREASSYNQKLNISKKSSTSEILNSCRTKSPSQSKSRLIKSVSEKNIDSRDTTRSIQRESNQKRNGHHKKNDLQSIVQKSTKSQKDTVQSKENREDKQRRVEQKSRKNIVQSHNTLQKLVTIKIGPQEFEEILKLKNALLSEISFAS